jgi:integrase
MAVSAQPALAAATKEITFGQCADELIDNLSGSWANAKHAAQWKMTLTEYAAPLRSLPISDVDTDHVLSVLDPIWKSKPETASRLRGRIERVLSYAKAKKYRTGDNPALWRGHLDQILPPRARLTRGHHKALPYRDLPGFMERLQTRHAVAARALEFTILTAARTGEALGATWPEIDLEKALWTIPAVRMKAKREHRVPLSPAVVSLLRVMLGHRRTAGSAKGNFVFPTQMPGSDADAPLSSMAMEMILRRMEVPVTVHGFRSTFRDWSAERTDTPNEVCEAALAHVIGNRVEAAYRRGDLLEKRRKLMDDWALYCVSEVAGGGEQDA